jgi:hypothetical protein
MTEIKPATDEQIAAHEKASKIGWAPSPLSALSLIARIRAEQSAVQGLLKSLQRIEKIIDVNLGHQHEKIQDAKYIARDAIADADTHRIAILALSKGDQS